jgi:SAM-dependent methyltransferase
MPGRAPAVRLPAATSEMRRIPEALAAAFPVPASKRADLPAAVRDLSRILTSERGNARSYWRTPRLTAAYLYYFLPWNICRLSRLLPDLDLNLGPGARILDAGSGPLTLPLALWCARPELRSLPLDFVCADLAPHPLELGRTVLRALAGADFPWRIRTARASLDRMLLPRRGDSYDLIAALNVLNELCGERVARDAEHMEDALDALAAAATEHLRPGGRLLILEPGTRLGGKIVSLLRKGATARGCRVLAPCTHQAPCPMLRNTRAEPAPDTGPPSAGPMLRKTHTPPDASASGRVKDGSGPRFSGWCHFTCPADDAPDALRDLTRQAGLQKKRLAFSFLFMEKKPDSAPSAKPGKNAAESASPSELRVLSDPIALPGEKGPARYACSRNGLALLADAEHIPSSAVVRAAVRKDARGGIVRDVKSGLPVYVITENPPRKNNDGALRAAVVIPPGKATLRKGNN